jgi:hypothetical protein
MTNGGARQAKVGAVHRTARPLNSPLAEYFPEIATSCARAIGVNRPYLLAFCPAPVISPS